MKGEDTRQPRRRRELRLAAAVAVLITITMIGAIGTVIAQAERSSGPSDRRLSPSDGASPAPAAAASSVLDHARPESIVIPALGVDAAIMEVGLHDDGTMQVPPHAPWPESQAGWYRHSPVPGVRGPSVIVGHVDSDRHGASVFYGLDTLVEGDRIEVRRADSVTAVFVVERTARYLKGKFPNEEVYGNVDRAGLRLITCGGNFDRERLEYEDNIVVYAHLVSSHPSGEPVRSASRPS